MTGAHTVFSWYVQAISHAWGIQRNSASCWPGSYGSDCMLVVQSAISASYECVRSNFCYAMTAEYKHGLARPAVVLLMLVNMPPSLDQHAQGYVVGSYHLSLCDNPTHAPRTQPQTHSIHTTYEKTSSHTRAYKNKQTTPPPPKVH